MLDLSHLKNKPWPRLRDLPEAERIEFEKALRGQTYPLIDGLPMEEQDAYYPWDYAGWKAGAKWMI